MPRLGTRVALSSKFDVVVLVLAKINTRAAGTMHGVDVLGPCFITAALLPRVLVKVIVIMMLMIIMITFVIPVLCVMASREVGANVNFIKG